MATKTVEAPTNGVVHKMGQVLDRGTTDDGRDWEDVYIKDGETYRVSQVFVDDSDAAFDASQNEDGTFNARLNSRMLLATSILKPNTTVDDMARWTNPKFVALLRSYDRLNTLAPADDQGN